MAINSYSKHIRVHFDKDELEVKGEFKQLTAVADKAMSRRAVELMRLDIAYWKATGEILDLSNIGEVVGKLTSPGKSIKTNGHSQQPQEVKITKPHKSEVGKTGDELENVD